MAKILRTLRTDDEAWRDYDRVAKAKGLTRSAWIRMVLDRAAKRQSEKNVVGSLRDKAPKAARAAAVEEVRRETGPLTLPAPASPRTFKPDFKR